MTCPKDLANLHGDGGLWLEWPPKMKRPSIPPPLLGGLALASSAFFVLAYHFIFVLFHQYDWGQPFVKLACFESLAGLILALALWRPGRDAPLPRWVFSVELALAAALLLWELVRAVGLFRTGLATGMNDLGDTTRDAARLLFSEHKNPFAEQVAKNGDDPAYWGYKYGPTMIFAYALAGVWPNGLGLKITNAIYLAATAGVVAYLGGWAPFGAASDARAGTPNPRGPGVQGASVAAGPHPRAERTARLAAAGWACALAILPQRLYLETFNQGAQDIFTILLLLVSIACVGRGWWLLAGLAAGLSFSSRSAPGAFLLVLFVRRRIPPRLVLGVALGLLPFVPFLMWNAPALVRNMILFHSFKTWDGTSLYSVTPRELHPLFSVFQAVVIAVMVAVGFRRRLEARQLLVMLTLLLIAIEVSYREMHGNHLIWFMPTAALAFAWGRHGLTRIASRAAPGTEPQGP